MTTPAAPEGYATVNPFLITRDVAGLIDFVVEVFGGREQPDARTMDTDGLLLHAEVAVGGTMVMFGERKPDWPFTPGLLQVYVDDVPSALATAERLGATVVTKPTEFYGDVFSRFVDPWKNLWWVYQHAAGSSDEVWGENGGADAEWSGGGDGDGDGDGQTGEETWTSTPELDYIHDTLLTTFPTLRE